MTRNRFSERQRLAAMALCALLATGCSQIRLPAIDPTGERIFLPSPYSTTLEHPCRGVLRTPACFEPAWVVPPSPPPCPEVAPLAPPVTLPVVAAPAPAPPPDTRPHGRHHLAGLRHHREQLGYITLNPTKVIAPVGGEVVLVAGLCDPAGTLVTREPVRWIMTNDSVGHFVEVGDDERSHLHFASRHTKLHSGNFAEGRTSSKRHVITRGTPSTLDDVTILAGQAWVSLTAPVEGVSHVTVIAPEAAIWSDRRQTATIHWIDAQWAFPPPAVVQAGSSHTLVTTVTRSTGEAPPHGWLVRYEMAGDSPAAFPGGQTAVDVPVDGSGQAPITLVSPPGQPGVTQVRVQLIRADATGSRLTIAEGWTSVTWSAPALAVDIAGPSVGTVGTTLVYRLQATNPGDIPVADLAISVDLPNGLRFVSSSPTAQVFGNRVEWRLGELPGRGRLEVELNLRAEFPQNYRITAQATAAGSLQAAAFVDTQIYQPSLDVQMEGPDTAQVGERVQYRVLVTNSGDYPLVDVLLRDRFDEGLQHAEGQSSPIERRLGTLQPGEERRVAVTFIVRQPGRWCHVLEVQADGQSKTVEACIVATQPEPVAPRVEVRKTAPRQVRVGETAKFTIDVVNTGQVVVSNVQIIDVLDAAFVPRFASDGFDPAQLPQGRLVWTVRQLAPGQRTVVELQCDSTQAKPAAINRATVTADPGVSETAETTTEILPAAAPAREAPRDENRAVAPPTDAPSAPVTGDLTVSIVDLTDPVNVGDSISYTITVRNARNVEDRNVRLRIILPDGLRFQRIRRAAVGPADAVPLQPRFSPDGHTVELPEIQSLRAGETLPRYELQVVAQQPGRFIVRAEVTSLRSPTPVQDTEETTVFAP